MNISINPCFLCNFSCNFCYLTPEQLRDNTRVSLNVLDRRLNEISTHKAITHIDLYGGEVTTLPADYITTLFDVIKKYYDGNVNVVTNLSRPLNRTQWLLRDDVQLSVSWDYNCREGWDTVMKNIALIPKPVHVLMLASKCVVDWTDAEIGAAQLILQSLSNVRSVEIKPYSTNQANQYPVTFVMFEEFIKRWIASEHQLPVRSQYEFVNDKLMDEAINGTRNAWSDDHIYITPTGKFGVLEFDLNDHEYFLELDTLGDYVKWTEIEKDRVSRNVICNKCKYFGNCLSEHLREVKNIDNSCNGFAGLLRWHEHRS